MPITTIQEMITSYVQSYVLYSGNASITNGMATVTIDGLACGVTYTIIAGGLLDGDLAGPRSSHGTITAGPCPLMTVTTTATITSGTIAGKKYSYIRTLGLNIL